MRMAVPGEVRRNGASSPRPRRGTTQHPPQGPLLKSAAPRERRQCVSQSRSRHHHDCCSPRVAAGLGAVAAAGLGQRRRRAPRRLPLPRGGAARGHPRGRELPHRGGLRGHRLGRRPRSGTRIRGRPRPDRGRRLLVRRPGQELRRQQLRRGAVGRRRGAAERGLLRGRGRQGRGGRSLRRRLRGQQRPEDAQQGRLRLLRGRLWRTQQLQQQRLLRERTAQRTVGCERGGGEGGRRSPQGALEQGLQELPPQGRDGADVDLLRRGERRGRPLQVRGPAGRVRGEEGAAVRGQGGGRQLPAAAAGQEGRLRPGLLRGRRAGPQGQQGPQALLRRPAQVRPGPRLRRLRQQPGAAQAQRGRPAGRLLRQRLPQGRRRHLLTN